MTGKSATLELAVLGLLHDSPLHGYELRKRLNLLLGRTRLLSYGSLYPALKRLLRADHVSEDSSADPGVSRRQRIVYRITPAGQEWFAGRLSDVGPSAWEDEDFTMRFAFFSRIDAEVRLRVLEGRRSRLQERLDRTAANRSPSGPPSGPVDRYVQELQRHSVESVERELRWLTGLIEAERAARTTQQPQAPPPPPAAVEVPDLPPASDPSSNDSRPNDSRPSTSTRSSHD